jgi:RHS repeat-associated protein
VIRRVVPSFGIGGLDRYTYGSSFLADTLTYTYDIAGNTLTANNIFAQITRAYNLNGSLAADTERVRESDSASTALSHVYGIGYGYDLEGRRSWLKHPGTLADFGADSVAYSYDATTGMLKSVRDPYGNRFGFAYDAALRLSSDTATMTTGTALLQTRSYDNESRMVGRRETQNAVTFIQDSLFYDARNKETAATFLSDGSPASESNLYAKVGSLAQHVSPGWNDTLVTDALGHQRSRTNYIQGTTTTNSLYDTQGSAELTLVATARAFTMKDTTINSYNSAGSLWTTASGREVAASGIGHPIPYFARTRTWNRYGSNLQLMASETLLDTVDANGNIYPPTTYYEREEYRYDAMGRRIWRRLIRPTGLCSVMNKASGCLSVVERTVWDGDQVLWEVRADGGDGASAAAMEVDAFGARSRPSLEGRVFYTHGAGIDHPLSIGRLDSSPTVIIPEYDYRGNAISGYCTTGTLCTQLEWPEQLQSPWDQDPPPSDPLYGGPAAWAGNLIDTHKDGSGYVYMRNRYYDPSSGRFTQVDPIGLAGGLNAYGFAGGDPVNYSDPFGLTCLIEGNCTQSEVPGDLRTVPGHPVFLGAVVSASLPGIGATEETGVVANFTTKTLGTYNTSGPIFGSKGFFGGLHGGVSSSEAAFHGQSAGGCATGGEGLSGGPCIGGNNAGVTGSGVIGFGANTIPFGVSGELTNTTTTPHLMGRLIQAVSSWAEKHHIGIPNI